VNGVLVNYSTQKELTMVTDFHQKFKQPDVPISATVLASLSAFWYSLISGEVDEYKRACKSDDIPGVAKELADVLYAVYGTILEHGLCNKMDAVFAEVHRSNMSKEYHEYKMIKGSNHTEPNLRGIIKTG